MNYQQKHSDSLTYLFLATLTVCHVGGIPRRLEYESCKTGFHYAHPTLSKPMQNTCTYTSKCKNNEQRYIQNSMRSPPSSTILNPTSPLGDRYFIDISSMAPSFKYEQRYDLLQELDLFRRKRRGFLSPWLGGGMGGVHACRVGRRPWGGKAGHARG